jgi:hypothetical protein
VHGIILGKEVQEEAGACTYRSGPCKLPPDKLAWKKDHNAGLFLLLVMPSVNSRGTYNGLVSCTLSALSLTLTCYHVQRSTPHLAASLIQ